MIELTVESAPNYLASRGLPIDGLRVKPLGGGVSNEVLLCEWPLDSSKTPGRIVIKQALGRLRVAEEWLADRGRIEREWAAIELASRLMPPGSAPDILWTDAINGIYAMSAAPATARPWKELLMVDTPVVTGIAEKVAAMLAAWIRKSWADESLRRQFGDKKPFDQLRLDPYYRFTATRHPSVGPWLHALVDRSLGANLSLVHGDWSPKNILVHSPSALDVWAIDFEVVHFGDPAFDVAFLLNHLLLKWIHRGMSTPAILVEARSFWTTLEAELQDKRRVIEASTLQHLPALMLARVDGKSPAEYLTAAQRPLARQSALKWIGTPPASILHAIDAASEWSLA